MMAAVSAKEYIDSFIAALRCEIEACKNDEPGAFIQLANGKLIKASAGEYLYLFDLSQDASIEDDTQATLVVVTASGQKEHECTVVHQGQLHIYLCTKVAVGNDAGNALLYLKPALLHEQLLQAFELTKETADSEFALAAEIFCGNSRHLNAGRPEYLLDTKRLPNQSHKNAVIHSYNQTLSIIWSPPGTGRLVTLARIAQAHMSAGRRVLLLSYRNKFVDNALECICSEVENTFYQDRQIIRLGACTSKKLIDQFPHIFTDNQANDLLDLVAQEKEKYGQFLKQVGMPPLRAPYYQDFSREDARRARLGRALLVGTTIAKTFTFDDLPKFDVVIVDQCGAASLPQLFLALGKATAAVTLCGDFNQWQPVCAGKEAIVKHWLSGSIFNLLNVDTPQKARADERVVFLDTQYRLAPAIASIADELFYGGYLQNANITADLHFDDSITGDRPLGLVDTGRVGTWAGSPPGGDRYNLVNAIVVASMVREISANNSDANICVMTRYLSQCRLIRHIFEDYQLKDVEIDLIQSFHGEEKDIVIFDTVDAPGSPIDDQDSCFTTSQLINMAITCARKKFYLVGHINYLLEKNKQHSLVQLLTVLQQRAIVIDCSRFINDIVVREDDRLNETSASAMEFWSRFCADLDSAVDSVVIMSPLVDKMHTQLLAERLENLTRRGIDVKIFTKPATTYGDNLIEEKEQCIKNLEKLHCKVHLRRGMHQKLCLIDNTIIWEGSLNLLAAAKQDEHMRRLVLSGTVAELLKCYGLRDAARFNVSQRYCPECGSELILLPDGSGRGFGCPAFPICRYKEENI